MSSRGSSVRFVLGVLVLALAPATAWAEEAKGSQEPAGPALVTPASASLCKAPALLQAERAPAQSGAELGLFVPAPRPTCSGDDCGCYEPPCNQQCAAGDWDCFGACRRAQRDCAVACCSGGGGGDGTVDCCPYYYDGYRFYCPGSCVCCI
jgi:hypothetical protein